MEKLIVVAIDSKKEKSKILAPKVWPEEIGQEFERMDEDFKKWLLGDSEDDLPVGVAEFRKYLTKERGERGMEGLVMEYVYRILSNKLVENPTNEAIYGDSFDEAKLRETVKTFADSIIKQTEVPISEAILVCDLGKQEAERIAKEYNESCDVYEEMIGNRKGLIVERDKKKGDRSWQRVNEKILALEKEMSGKALVMNRVIDDCEFPLSERERIGLYPAMIQRNIPYSRGAVMSFLERQRQDIAKKTWMIGNVLTVTNNINIMVDRISSGWEFKFLPKILEQKRRVSQLDKYGPPEAWEEQTEVLNKMEVEASRLKNVMDEELLDIFTLEKQKMEKRMDEMKMKDIKEIFSLTVDQIRREENPDNKRIIQKDCLAYLRFMESKYKQARSIA